MKFLVDENIDYAIVVRLRKEGYTVFSVSELTPGISDNEIIELCNREKAILVTADKDFGTLLFRQGAFTQGVILVRLVGLPPERKARTVVSVIREHQEELWGNFTVISPRIVRIRKLRK